MFTATKKELLEIIMLKREAQKRNCDYSTMHHRIEFAVKRHLSSYGTKMDFNNHAYLLPLYCDDSQKIRVKKPRKVGVSEWLNVRIFEGALNKLSTMYVLPKQSLRNVYVAERINPLIESCYTDMMHRDSEGSVMLKKFKNRANTFFAGSNSQSELIMIVADQLIIDEYDFCEQKNIKVAEGVLGYSNYGIDIRVSTPTTEGVGIDEALIESDNKHWFNRCEHCGERQILNFFGNVLEKADDESGEWMPINSGIAVHCIKCRKPMDRHAQGEYVSARQHEISGYSIPALCHPKKTVESLFESWQTAKNNEYEKQIFYNHELGECYTPEGSNISQNLLDKLKENYNLTETHTDIHDRCVMGIDVGKYYHVIVGRFKQNKLQIIYIRKLLIEDDRSSHEILSLIKRLNVKRGIIDIAPERKLAHQLCKASNWVIWQCEYKTREFPKEIYTIDKANKVIGAERTWSIEEMVEAVTEQRMMLPREAGTVDDGTFYAQMQAPVRTAIKTTKGRIIYEWKEGSQDDHYFHAMNYCNIAKAQINSLALIGANPDRFQPDLKDREMTSAMKDFDMF